MNGPNDSTAARGLRAWWQSPPRSGLQRLINPWEYRHLRAFGVMRIAGGSVAIGASVICLSYAVYGWAAFFGAIAALNLAGGSWYITIDRSAAA
jgi:CHASE2 domain-containing sensor protein